MKWCSLLHLIHCNCHCTPQCISSVAQQNIYFIAVYVDTSNVFKCIPVKWTAAGF